MEIGDEKVGCAIRQKLRSKESCALTARFTTLARYHIQRAKAWNKKMITLPQGDCRCPVINNLRKYAAERLTKQI